MFPTDMFTAFLKESWTLFLMGHKYPRLRIWSFIVKLCPHQILPPTTLTDYVFSCFTGVLTVLYLSKVYTSVSHSFPNTLSGASSSVRVLFLSLAATSSQYCKNHVFISTSQGTWSVARKSIQLESKTRQVNDTFIFMRNYVLTVVLMDG